MRKKARELITGEMIRMVLERGDDQWFMHSYWKVIGHKHEEKKVLAELVWDREYEYKQRTEINYEDTVVVTPFGYKTIRPEL